MLLSTHLNLNSLGVAVYLWLCLGQVQKGCLKEVMSDWPWSSTNVGNGVLLMLAMEFY